MARSSKPRHAHRARLIKIPMMATLHNQMALEMHAALASLSMAPGRDQFDAIGQYFNMIGLTIENDPRFAVEFVIIESGARAMNQIADCYDRTATLQPTYFELLPVRNAVIACDQILPRLDLTKLHVANVKLAAMRCPA